MENSIFGSIVVEFTDDEIRKFLTDDGYVIEMGKDTVKDFPIGLREVECEVAYRPGAPRELGGYPADYRKVFNIRMNHYSSEFMSELGKSEDIKDRLKKIVLKS